MRECYRVLRPNGCFRIALPDFQAVFGAYLRGDAEYFAQIEAIHVLSSIDPEARTLVDYINYAVYQFGQHKYIYDREKLTAVLQQIGFRSVVATVFQSGIDPDNPLRRQYSFYTEAIK
jgi:predicted SAM-dependent methyltransferase